MKPTPSSRPSAPTAAPLADKLVRYGAGLGALAAVASLPSHSARAAMTVYNGNGLTGGTIYFNLPNTAPSPSTSTFSGADFELYSTTGPAGLKPGIVPETTGAGIDTTVSGQGATVSSSDAFTTAALTYYGGTNEYIGLRVPVSSTDTTDYYYGSVHFTYNSMAQTVSLYEYGYNNTPNAPATIVPEPSAAALLITGAAGVGILAARRRKASGEAGA